MLPLALLQQIALKICGMNPLSRAGPQRMRLCSTTEHRHFISNRMEIRLGGDTPRTHPLILLANPIASGFEPLSHF